ncbi:MAG TPA: ABC transporter ATP-binding protein [Chitinophagaceae bacterium]|jgi:Cu-processing system ATP-binding protein|nr:ABC transporter ATP-binding protein [Chitinophagaceae bacterium]
MIRINHIHKHFRKLHALNDVTATFSKGQVISLIGPNGSGKTTLIKSILGMVKADKGTITFNGQDIAAGEQYRSQIGYMPQIGRYPDNMKIRQVIDMIRNIRGGSGSPDLDLYQSFGIKSLEEKTMQSLSGGTRQKVSATIAFLFSPEVLILDEPTAGLDPVASEILKEKILEEKSKGKLILLTSHILSDLDELTTDVLYLQDGKVQFFDALDRIKSNTGEERLGRAIAQIMQHGYHPNGNPVFRNHSKRA